MDELGELIVINTVSGLIEATDFGNVLMHEHIGCISNDLMHIFKNKWLNKQKLADYASEVLKNIKREYGVGLFVDGTPIDLGRDVLLIKKVSEQTDIPIVVSSGLYHYPSLYTSYRSEKEIASWFISEFEVGIEGTNIKPGILKVASDYGILSKDNEKRLTAMSIVQRETHLPIYVHSVHDGETQRQIEILCNNIIDREKIIIGHAALNPDAEYLQSILDAGCYICMDQCHCTKHSIETIGKTLSALCQKGYSDKILLANDLCIYSDFAARNNNGLNLFISQQTERFGHIFKVVHNSFLENGGSERYWNKMLKGNPIKVLDVGGNL